jgi:hypothetical protein
LLRNPLAPEIAQNRKNERKWWSSALFARAGRPGSARTSLDPLIWLVRMLQVTGIAALCVWSSRALAQASDTENRDAPVELQRIEFQAPATCATAEVFFDEVRSRTPRLRLTVGEDWTARFELAVRDDGEAFVGALTVYSDRTTSERREVKAKSCEEVLETLALIVAVAIDPNASLGRRPKRLAPKPEDSPPAMVATPARAARPVATPPPPPRARAAWHGRVALGVEARGALADDASLAGIVAFELERTLPERWGWTLRLSALRSLESRVSDPFGRDARFRWTAGRLDAGPMLFDRSHTTSLQGGLGLDLGTVEATSALSETRLWVSTLAFLRARWTPVPRFGLEMTAGAFTPIKRDKFALFDPDTVVYRERALSGFVGFALHVRL